jgi:HlyD family secretion protein
VLTVDASLAAAKFDLERAKADLFLAEEEYKRAQRLIEQGVYSKSQFDTAESRYKAAQAVVRAQQSRVEQFEAQLRDSKIRVDVSKAAIASADARIAQAQANLRGAQDRYTKTVQKAPIDGVIASLPVRVGQYALTTFSTTPLITIADMSEINVEVQVDETDITHVHPGLKAKIKVDALGEVQIDGMVKEVGQAAMTAAGSTLGGGGGGLGGPSQEAKDFKVVINLVNMKEEIRNRLRPGMSATATITTNTRENVIAIPLQAIVEREVPSKSDEAGKATSAKAEAGEKKTAQGVFVMDGNRVKFRPVQTGITGETDIEIVSGLKEGEEIVVGPFRELRNLKDDTVVKKEKSVMSR